jgi:hypothetical protein
MSSVNQTPQQDDMVPQDVFITQMVIIFLIATGITLLLFSVAYIRDLQTLRNVPDAIWDALCGRPTDDGITLPLLLTSSTLMFITAGGLAVWQRWLKAEPEV